MGYNKIMMRISQHRAGFMGDVTKTRGRVCDEVSCPLGCGMGMLPFVTKTHMLECTYREVPCPLNCGIRRLQFREVELHCAEECMLRPVQCRSAADL